MAIINCPKCGTKNRVDERAQSLRPVCGKCGAPLPPAAPADGTPVVVTDGDFDTVVLGSARPVLVDCWAPWCGPCRMIGPVVDELARESGGRYVVAKLNVDENQRTAAQFRIDSIPTLLIFKGRQLVDRLVGLQPKQALAARLAAHL